MSDRGAVSLLSLSLKNWLRVAKIEGVKPTALILSRDAASLPLFRQALSDVGMETEVLTGTRNAATTVEAQAFGAIIVDCDDLDGGKDFLDWAARTHSSDAIIVAVTNHLTSLHEAFHIGATFVLQKPLSPERVLRCIRASSELLAVQPQATG